MNEWSCKQFGLQRSVRNFFDTIPLDFYFCNRQVWQVYYFIVNFTKLSLAYIENTCALALEDVCELALAYSKETCE